MAISGGALKIRFSFGSFWIIFQCFRMIFFILGMSSE